MTQVLLAWSGGKDCAWALHLLRQDPQVQVAALLTTFSSDRVAMHAVRRELIEAQAGRGGLPLWPVELPWPCPNTEYESRMRAVCERARAEGVAAVAFGDLFLEDIRQYREQQLQGTGLQAIFPLWGLPTGALAREMIAAGLQARLACVDSEQISGDFAGREFDAQLLHELPSNCDPCGENGEFHTFVTAGPFFSEPIAVRAGEIDATTRFIKADILPG